VDAARSHDLREEPRVRPVLGRDADGRLNGDGLLLRRESYGDSLHIVKRIDDVSNAEAEKLSS
jgi:hypothetical protein